METVAFWIAWFIVSSWVLHTFYFSYDKDKLKRLRLTSFGIDLSVLLLFFLPWLPVARGGFTGIVLMVKGDIFVILLGILIICSTGIFLTKDKALLKIGALAHGVSSVLFIATMMRLMPSTTTISMQSSAPIFASLLLLGGNVVVLLLWQQLQLKEKKHKRKT